MTITQEEYFGLLLAEEKLLRLEAGGVDNWEWFGDSLNPDGESSFEEFAEDLRKAIFGENNALK